MDFKKMFWKLEVQLFPKSIMTLSIYELCLPPTANRTWSFQGLFFLFKKKINGFHWFRAFGATIPVKWVVQLAVSDTRHDQIWSMKYYFPNMGMPKLLQWVQGQAPCARWVVLKAVKPPNWLPGGHNRYQHGNLKIHASISGDSIESAAARR